MVSKLVVRSWAIGNMDGGRSLGSMMMLRKKKKKK